MASFDDHIPNGTVLLSHYAVEPEKAHYEKTKGQI